MGFTADKVDKALKQTKNAGLQPAMDYLIEHADDIESAPSDPMDSTESLDDGGEISQDQVTAQSLKCDDCGRFFKDCESIVDFCGYDV